MRRTSKRETSRLDIFSVLDSSNDGELIRSEYRFFYKNLDVNKDLRLTLDEVIEWIDDNMDSICARYRPAMITKKIE